MTKEAADKLEIEIATRLIRREYNLDYEEASTVTQKTYRADAAEIIAMVIEATKA